MINKLINENTSMRMADEDARKKNNRIDRGVGESIYDSKEWKKYKQESKELTSGKIIQDFLKSYKG